LVYRWKSELVAEGGPVAESLDSNAVMERFFWLLKHEWTKHESFESLNRIKRTRLAVLSAAH